MDGAWRDVHGASAQRSDPKSGEPDNYPTGNDPQSDAIRIYNYVRLVRNADDGQTSEGTRWFGHPRGAVAGQTEATA